MKAWTTCDIHPSGFEFFIVQGCQTDRPILVEEILSRTVTSLCCWLTVTSQGPLSTDARTWFTFHSSYLSIHRSVSHVTLTGMCTTSIKLRVSFLDSLRESRPANKDISVTLHSFCLQTFSSDSEIPISTLQRLRGELQPKAVGKILSLGKHLEPVHSLTRGHWVLSGGFPYCSC